MLTGISNLFWTIRTILSKPCTPMSKQLTFMTHKVLSRNRKTSWYAMGQARETHRPRLTRCLRGAKTCESSGKRAWQLHHLNTTPKRCDVSPDFRPLCLSRARQSAERLCLERLGAFHLHLAFSLQVHGGWRRHPSPTNRRYPSPRYPSPIPERKPSRTFWTHVPSWTRRLEPSATHHHPHLSY